MAQVEIHLDGRETRVAQELSKLGVEYTSRELSPGDVLFTRGLDTLLICERKTYADLSSSIADGRYAQQRAAMKETGAQVLYIIEGPNKPRTDLDARRVLGAMENLAVIHKIPVLPTTSTAETALALQHIRKKLQETAERTGDEVVVSKIVRRKDKIMANVLSHQLQVITGVSPDIAQAVVTVYPTMRNLILAYEALTTEDERKAMLQDVKVGKRRLGPAVSQRVYQSLCGI